MADTVNLFGSRVKKGYVIAGGAVVAVAVVYGWYKNKQAADSASPPQSSADTVASGAYPPDGTVGDTTDPNSTDPDTGETYGNEGEFSTGYGALGYGALDTYGYTGGGGGYYASSTAASTAYSTNGAWAQAAEDYLVNTVGADATTIAAALGKYITGQAVSADQMSVIEQAIAFSGYPPVNGPDGYPPSIRQSAAASPPTSTGTGTTATTTVPRAPAMPSGVTVTGTNRSGGSIRWNASAGAKSYRVRLTYQQQLAKQVTTSATSVSISGLTPNHTYTVHVAAVGAGGISPETNGPALKTTK